jgi:hypothetical protein
MFKVSATFVTRTVGSDAALCRRTFLSDKPIAVGTWIESISAMVERCVKASQRDLDSAARKGC